MSPVTGLARTHHREGHQVKVHIRQRQDPPPRSPFQERFRAIRSIASDLQQRAQVERGSDLPRVVALRLATVVHQNREVIAAADAMDRSPSPGSTQPLDSAARAAYDANEVLAEPLPPLKLPEHKAPNSYTTYTSPGTGGSGGYDGDGEGGSPTGQRKTEANKLVHKPRMPKRAPTRQGKSKRR